MQPVMMNEQIRDRREAGFLLSKVLDLCRETNSVVVGIPNGGVCVAAAIADALSLSLEIMLCRTIRHPADKRKSVGAVTDESVFIKDYSHTIPQDYIAHQVVLLRNGISHEMKTYYASTPRQSFRYRSVILVDEMLAASDAVMACVRNIRNQNPLKVIVAVPVVAAEAARQVSSQTDDFKFIRMEPSLESPDDYFVSFPRIEENEVRQFLEASRKKHKVYESNT